MLQVESTITINRPVEEVFAFSTDWDKYPLWESEVLESQALTPGPLAPGQRYRHVARFMGRRLEAEGIVTAFEPNRRMCFRVTSRPFPWSGCQSFETVPGGTMADVERDPEWMDGVLDSKRLDAGPLRPGSRYRRIYRPWMSRVPVDLTLEVTELVPPTVFGYRQRMMNTDWIARYTVQPDGDGTRLVLAADVQPHGIMRLVAPLIYRLFRKDIGSEVYTLKRVLENGR